MRRSLIIISALVCLPNLIANAQLFAPNRNWASTTQYVGSDDQDSIFVFFNSVQPSFRAQFSDSSEAVYAWYRFKYAAFNSEFELLENITDSIYNNPIMGGYRVDVKRISDDSLETYIAWAMFDNVSIVDLMVEANTCQSLVLMLYTIPDAPEIISFFSYHDLSVASFPDKSVLPQGSYFVNNSFQSLNPKNIVSSQIHHSVFPFIIIEYENNLNGKSHGPLYDSGYRLTITTPFGRGNLVVETPVIQAVATKADFDISFWDEDKMDFGSPQTNPTPKGEALLEIKLESKSINADSIYWNIINDKLRIQMGGDTILWSYGQPFFLEEESGNIAFPPKNLMRPGIYEIEHISSITTNGVLCRDTLPKTIEVDTSFIRNIPNVFTPGGSNPYFKISEDDLMSIKSFKIVILSRSGRQVYRYQGDPKKWEGWNGKIDGTKGDAQTGVYYYVIDAVGWDGVRYRNGQYKGFLHLYR